MKKLINVAFTLFIVLECVVLSAAIIIVLSTAYIEGSSMEGTIHNDDVCIMNKLNTKNLDMYDIITFYCPSSDKNLIKRIVATEGDTIEIKNNNIYVNSQLVDHSQFTKLAVNKYEDLPLQTVPKDSYFVMGDNRGNSRDSRDSSVGFVHESQIKGKLMLNLTDRFGLSKYHLLIFSGIMVIIFSVAYIISCSLSLRRNPTQSSPAH